MRLRKEYFGKFCLARFPPVLFNSPSGHRATSFAAFSYHHLVYTSSVSDFFEFTIEILAQPKTNLNRQDTGDGEATLCFSKWFLNYRLRYNKWICSKQMIWTRAFKKEKEKEKIPVSCLGFEPITCRSTLYIISSGTSIATRRHNIIVMWRYTSYELYYSRLKWVFWVEANFHRSVNDLILDWTELQPV